jgi:general secretion pathway protein C
MLRYLFIATAFVLIGLASRESAGKNVLAEDIYIRIMGSIISKISDRNVVLLKDITSGKVSAHRIGDTIKNKYRITDIQQEYLKLITITGNEELTVFQDKFSSEASASNQPKGPAPATAAVFSEPGFERKDRTIAMTSAYRDKLVKEDLAKILMQATAQPYMEDGAIIGFSLTQIDEGSIYWKSGLQDGDIVTSINGIALTSVSGAIKLLHTLKNSDSIEVEYQRNGSKQELNLNIN